MKRVIILAISFIVCAGLFAQANITPYGSARVWYGFDMYNEDHEEGGADGRTYSDLMLQTNSRFGIDYKTGDLTAKVELGYGKNDTHGHFRYLWAKHNFGTFSLGAGLDDDGFNKRATQVHGNDKMLEGYGAIYTKRNPQIKFEMDNGFYISALKPYTANDPAGDQNGISDILPRFNLGYNLDLDAIKIYPTVSFQRYSYNKDFSASSEAAVMSWLAGVTADFNADALSLRGHFHFGSNVGNMYEGVGGSAVGINTDDETDNQTTMGFFVTAGFDISDVINVGGGFGFASIMREDWENDTKMAFYLQSVLKAGNLSVIPEFGMLMDGDKPQPSDSTADPEARGTHTYFGVQLRYGF